MGFSVIVLVVLILSLFYIRNASAIFNQSDGGSHLHGIALPEHFQQPSLTEDCELNPSGKELEKEKKKNSAADEVRKPTLKVQLNHIDKKVQKTRTQALLDSCYRDMTRIEKLHKKTSIQQRETTQNPKTHYEPTPPSSLSRKPPGTVIATLESGVTLGSGEYFMDVFIGTPPKHYSLILDTGSDLNWLQCLPCHHCFEQHGPFYDPHASSSYTPISCHDSRCSLVQPPEPIRPCMSNNQTCEYFYWYGDQSNTTGDFAMETFTLNITSPIDHEENPSFFGESQALSGERNMSSRERNKFSGERSLEVKDIMFGCGHWNRGLFHGAAGLLGLGRGPLSFSSQLQSKYGSSFSYCLVDRNSEFTVTSKLIFGEDPNLLKHPNVQFTSLIVSAKNSTSETFYYVEIDRVKIGGKFVEIPPESFKITAEGTGGTIVDSGTTLSYFAKPAYKKIKDAFEKWIKFPRVENYPVLDPCYNVSGLERVELPVFEIIFRDGAVWSFPVENYFIRFEPEGVVCLAILETPRSYMSILGNYQQQNFHVLYDVGGSRLGFAPMKCAEV
ncbi:hypothetical protein AMTR_s00014p00246430 [Amborella trichopoda]|uniref:Peptidase A1 domain-containing protein n=2 Tax=Amborella trichopoda TaxID=13333 RepID=W1PPU2_AMBTC|nr:hypothetical protein AMTR_s00014p00246430 [Amborella trichopoda]